MVPTASARRAVAVATIPIAMAACGPRTSAVDEQVGRGEDLYQASCAACHGGGTGGDIADIPPRHNAQGHTWHHADCELIEIIQDGTPRRPGLPDDSPTMPPFGDQLGDDDVSAILAFMKICWTEDQLAFQEEVTGQTCD